MPLPTLTAPADIDSICGYLLTKPSGATPAEIINQKAFDRRKLSALKFWGLIEDTGTKLRLSERGQLVARDNGINRATALREVVASIAPYAAVIARAIHRNEMIFLSTDVAAYWHEHFKIYVRLGILNHQAVCFLRVAEGAQLGCLVVGRKGQPTRFELAEDAARALVDCTHIATSRSEFEYSRSGEEAKTWNHSGFKPDKAFKRGDRVFITHRMKKKMAEQVKELVTFGKFEPVVAEDRKSAEPFHHDLMEEMRGCGTAVVHVGIDGLLFDPDHNDGPRIDGDVLLEIGAAMALYGRDFILLVEEAVRLPPNLQGFCECRYRGDELDMPAVMRLFKAFNDFAGSQPMRLSAHPIGANHVVTHVPPYDGYPIGSEMTSRL
jgi:Predicted nucleotide-binding protein containing TIR-like domain